MLNKELCYKNVRNGAHNKKPDTCEVIGIELHLPYWEIAYCYCSMPWLGHDESKRTYWKGN